MGGGISQDLRSLAANSLSRLRMPLLPKGHAWLSPPVSTLAGPLFPNEPQIRALQRPSPLFPPFLRPRPRLGCHLSCALRSHPGGSLRAPALPAAAPASLARSLPPLPPPAGRPRLPAAGRLSLRSWKPSPPPRPLAPSPAEGHSFPCRHSPEHFPARGGRCVPLLCPFRSLCLPLVAPIRLNSLAGLYCLPQATKPDPVFSPPHSQPLTPARNISLVWVARP